jgi:low affinity Fe/Cu permease
VQADWFYRLATTASLVAGSAWMFLGSVLAFGVWLVLGPFLQWSDAFHLWPTSILTWLTWILVILIQHTQTHQETALQTKLDELIRAIDAADNRLIGLEKQPPSAGPPEAG